MGNSLILSLALTAPTLAQSLTAAPDGTGTIIHHEGNIYHIQGGTQAGANLFHSFQVFGLSTGEIANFLSNPSVTNILGRVTGGDPSVINGLIQVTGASSNLYLMNPAGIVFGSGASLNVGGDFTATTSDRIGFANGWFNATGANDYATLVGAPNQFAFLSDQPGAILNLGALSTTGNLSLLGGTVINQGSVASTAGTVTLATLPGERLVRIGEPGMLLSLELDAGAIGTGIAPADLPTLLTGTGGDYFDNWNAGVSPAPDSFNPGDLLIAGEVSGQNIDLYAADTIRPTDADLIQGDTRVIRFSANGENPDQAVFIDRRADNPETLLYGAEAGTVAQSIERDEDGISVVSEQLGVISKSVGELESVAIVAEGNQGNFWLGNQWIRSDNITDHAAYLQTWGEALSTNADILLYSCFTALGATGEALVQSIADMTGADVATSVDATGSSNYAANWILERRTGNIETDNPFTSETLNSWDGKLATQTVDSLTDDGSGGTTLREAIAAANAGDLVTFSVVGTVTLNGTEIAWNNTKDNLTIDGNGSTIDANNSSRIFNISADNATIQNLTLQQGRVTGVNNGGGGIHHSGTGTIAFNHATISNNSNAVSSGGGIYSNSGAITVTNSMIAGNLSGNRGGGIFSDSGMVTVTDSIVLGNSTSGGGGGIYSNSGMVTVTDSTVSGNLAANGGGVYSRSTSSLINSTVSNNSTSASGGGIFSWGAATINNSTISGNLAGMAGGGIFSYGAAIINNSTISRNSAVMNNGGGMLGLGATTINNSTISGNSSGVNGGGVAGGSTPTSSITINNSTISGNLAANMGGGVAGGSTTASTITINNHIGDLDLDIYAQSAVNLSGTGSITLTGSVQPLAGEELPLTIKAANHIDLTGLALPLTAGGDITLTAGGNINTKNLLTSGAASGAGNITLTSTGGSINTFNGSNGSLDTRAGVGNAGTVTLTAAQDILVGPINTEAQNGVGGAVVLESDRFVRVEGSVASNIVSFPASISTVGFPAGGSIRIRHGGNGLIPFIVGDTSRNGTSAAITAGNGFTIFPTNPYLVSHLQPGIEILTNGASGSNLGTVIAGTEPISQNLSTEDLIRLIGRQAGGDATFDNAGGYTLELPNETLGGSLNDPAIADALGSLDAFLGDSYAPFSEQATEIADDDGGGDGENDDDEDSVSNIRETFSRIQTQTGTTPALIYALSQPDALELILVTPDNQLRRKVVPAADRASLSKTIRTFRRRVTGLRNNYLDPAQQLYDWLIRPLENSIENLNIDTLVFAMGDGLRAIPLAALHDGEQFLIEKYSLGQIPSLSLTDSSYVPLNNANVLAMGASEFETLNPLPAVASELKLVTQQQTGEQYLNAAFTWENLKQQSRNRTFDIVHLATHASFQAGAADNAYIHLWGNGRVGVEQLRELRWFDAPTVELLVLSACETALGDAQAELGFAGLAVQSGVKSALASLWQVSDVGTLALMNQFYGQLGNPAVTIKAEALRQAQLALLQGNASLASGELNGIPLTPELARYANTDLSHPFYWSAFTLVGSPW